MLLYRHRARPAGQRGRINREALEMAKAEETVGNDGELGLDEWGDEGLEFGAG